MIFTYALIAGLAVLIIEMIFKLFPKNKYTSLRSWAPIVAAVISVSLFKQFGKPYYEFWQFERKLHTVPLFQILQKVSPQEYKIYSDKVKAVIIEGKNEELINNYTNTFVNSQLNKILPTATNLSIYNLAKETLDFYKKVDNPNVIISFEFPGFKSHDYLLMSKYEKDIQNILLAKYNIIKSANENPQPLMTKERSLSAKNQLINIISILGEKYGSDNVILLFNDFNNPNLNNSISAQILIDFYQKILSLGVDETGEIFKFIYSKKSG